MKDFFTTKQVCDILNISRQSVFYLRKKGILKNYEVLTKHLIVYSIDEVINLKNSRYGN
jgi:hypothetical protein